MKLGKILVLSLVLSMLGGTAQIEAANKMNNVTSNQYKYLISFEKVQEIALKKVPGAVITDVELDKERNLFVYDIDMNLNGVKYEIKINAKTGSGISVKKQGSVISSSKTVPSTNSQKTATSSKNTIGAERAKQIALNKVPDGEVIYLKQDRDDGKTIYEGKIIKGTTEYEFDIDAYSGVVLNWDVDYNKHQSNVNSKKQTTTVTQNTIGAARAKEIALVKVPNGQVVYLRQDRDDGRTVYEGKIIEGTTEYEFDIDAYSGDILNWDVDHIYD